MVSKKQAVQFRYGTASGEGQAQPHSLHTPAGLITRKDPSDAVIVVMLEEKRVMQCGANSRGRLCYFDARRPAEVESHRQGRQQQSFVWTANRQPCERGDPQQRAQQAVETGAAWRGARACSSAVAGRARLRPAVVCPVFRGWRQVLRQRCAGRESKTAPVRLRASSSSPFINAACSSSLPLLPHYCIHQTSFLH